MTASSLPASAGEAGRPSEKNTTVLRPGYCASDVITCINASEVS
jgi:hypothetical protein